MTDAGIAYLKRLEKLEQIFLKGTDVTDAALAHLRDLPSLQKVDVADTEVTEDALSDFELYLEIGDVY